MLSNKEDLIEAYLTNSLPKEEVSAFEAEMQKDPALKEEVSLQRDIMSVFQDQRKAELKSRLAAIEIKQGPSSMQLFGIAAATLSAGLLLTIGLYQYNKEENTAIPTTETQELVSANESKAMIATTEANESVKEEEIASSASNTADSKPAVTQKETSRTRTQTNSREQLVTPHPIDFESDANEIHHDAGSAPRDIYGDNDKDEIRAVTPTIENKGKKERLYKYDGEHLTLIGDFNSSEPYYLIEKPQNGVTKLYLKFENTFYIINETKKASALEAVKDSKLISELSKK